ncbi:serine hydrolase domain-containing protein [Hymenobacter psychrophilus]|uniref:CubicO group peptidase, beta-lactamase class C family n=1 Tax=Hymenobacter psychrophilus TaxID=651662 RepID=A0A1H3B7Z9_9BACT|nr:serine hydrolase domain-containing protein [Hymenobacter psychrophilus]SDX37771.1 CubicO group peptidase, beta-lactamase class C family [Hymenobacter psychrophilus]
MKLLLLLLPVLLLLSLRAPAQQTELKALLAQRNVPGLQLVHTKGSRVTTYNLGRLRQDSAAAVTAETVFQAASLGKVVLAYLALRLHDQGRLDLDRPLLSYAPYPRVQDASRAARVTARMVLTHRTGLPNWADNPLGPTWATSPLSFRFAPDSCWNYSGEGFVWLQKTLEQLTGEPLETLAQREVFGPLKMRRSSFRWQAGFAGNAACGHDKAGLPTEVRRFAEPYAAYSLLTTAPDYNRFLQALRTGRGLKQTTARLLTSSANEANRCGRPTGPADPFVDWAVGLGLATTSAGPALWHWGDNDDFQGFFLVLPGRRESLLFFTNSANGLQLTNDLLHLFIGPGEYRTQQWLAE